MTAIGTSFTLSPLRAIANWISDSALKPFSVMVIPSIALAEKARNPLCESLMRVPDPRFVVAVSIEPDQDVHTHFLRLLQGYPHRRSHAPVAMVAEHNSPGGGHLGGAVVFLAGSALSLILFALAGPLGRSIFGDPEAAHYIRPASGLILLNSTFQTALGFIRMQRKIGLHAALTLI